MSKKNSPATRSAKLGPGQGVPVLAIVDSGVVGVAKPDPTIFDFALPALGKDPSEVIYVGDSVKYDVRSAEAAGVTPLHLDPFGLTSGTIDAFVQFVSTSWGTPEMAILGNPSLSINDERNRIIARTMRASATPLAAAAQYDYILRNLDVRQALASIQTPTLILHTIDNRFIPIELGRYLADHIEGATMVELPGTDVNARTRISMALTR
jgi:phosphoglycolate phosphatase-like HAD superfamily hydrolase